MALKYTILEGTVDGTVNNTGSFTGSTDQFTDYANDDFTLLAAAAGIDTDTDRTDPDYSCLLYTSPSPRDGLLSRMPSSA